MKFHPIYSSKPQLTIFEKLKQRCGLLYLAVLIITAIFIQKAAAQDQPTIYEAGKDYKVVTQSTFDVDQLSKKPISVVNIFWYGCPHCSKLYEKFSKWRNDDKNIKKSEMPGAFFSKRNKIASNLWITHAQLFYTLKLMGALDKKNAYNVNRAIFNAVQVDKLLLDTPETMSEFLHKKFKIDQKKFIETYKSIEVAHKINKAALAFRKYKLLGVPAIIIADHYIIDPERAGSLDNMLKIADYLLDKIEKKKSS